MAVSVSFLPYVAKAFFLWSACKSSADMTGSSQLDGSVVNVLGHIESVCRIEIGLSMPSQLHKCP